MRRVAWLLLFALALAAGAFVVVPGWYVKPFTPQTATGLDRALALRDAAPPATIALAIACVTIAVLLWRGAGRWWRRALLVPPCVVAIGFAALARWNYFESMFAQAEVVELAPVADVDFVEDADIVLAVEIDGDAAAFPVRQMGYHHVAETDVGGKPIVATY